VSACLCVCLVDVCDERRQHALHRPRICMCMRSPHDSPRCDCGSPGRFPPMHQVGEYAVLSFGSVLAGSSGLRIFIFVSTFPYP